MFNGWIRAIRKSKNRMFLEVSNGIKEYQVVTSAISGLSIGTSVQCTGTIVNHNNKSEFHANDIKVIGKCDPRTYPLQSKRHTLEFLRSYPQLNSRRKFQSTILLYRDFLQFEIHKYFRTKEFVHINTPILTSNDCEGGGSTLKVKSELFKDICHLTVSAQLHLEAVNSGIENVYTLNPCFRAEKTLSSKHLAEFYMLEAELGFITNLNQLMDFVEDLFNHLITISGPFLLPRLANIKSELEFQVKEEQFKIQKIPRISYDKAYEILSKSPIKFEIPLEYGDLAAEHEKYLVEYHNSPVFVTHYPSSSKPFYMLRNSNNMAECFDFLVPNVGELVGGSLRSTDIMDLPNNLNWYNDIRTFGSIPHGGFGFGFERFIMYMLQLQSIRDTIPFPRYYKHIKC